jgi:hypothetical protein
MTKIDRVSILLGLTTLCVAANGQAPASDSPTARYWHERETALADYTFEWEVETHDRFVANKPVPPRDLRMGSVRAALPGLSTGFEFKKINKIAFARKGNTCQVIGTLPFYNLNDKDSIDLPARAFFGDGWVGDLAQVPKNGDLKQGMFEIFAQPSPAIACQAPQSSHEYDGEFAPFLYAVSPYEVYHLAWVEQPQSDGSILLSSQNFEGQERIVNHMSSNAPVEFQFAVDQAGRLLSAAQYVDRKTNPGKLPIHTVQVLAWKTVNGYQIPSDVKVHGNRDISGKTDSGFHDKHWRLVKAYPTKKMPVPPIPIGTSSGLAPPANRVRSVEPPGRRWRGGRLLQVGWSPSQHG